MSKTTNLNLPLKYEKLSDGTEIGRYERHDPYGSVVFICQDGIPVSFPFKEIVPAKDGYMARWGKVKCRLDKNGGLVSSLSPVYNADTIRGIIDDFTEAYLENARNELLQAFEEKDSGIAHFVSDSRIRARYEQGAS